jgi:hypothetical protein
MPRAIGGAEAGRTLCFQDSLPPDLLVRSPSADPPVDGPRRGIGPHGPYVPWFDTPTTARDVSSLYQATHQLPPST